MERLKLTVLNSLPTSYTAPLYRQLSEDPEIELLVLYCWEINEETEYYDKALGKMIKWDIPLLNGYSYYYLENRLKWDSSNPLGMYNPKIKQYINDHEIDALLIGTSWWSPTTWMAIMAARKKGIPIITRATVEKNKKRSLPLRILKKIVVGSYCRKMAAGVYECIEQKEFLEQYGMAGNALFSAPCAVDNDFFDQQTKTYNRDAEREKLHLPTLNTVVFSFLGTLTERKSPMDLLTAFSKIKEKGYDVALLFLGDGEKRPEMEEYIKNRNLNDVYLCGFVNQTQIGKYMVSSDVFVLPSKNDASPKALNEAMNFSLPIIITSNVGTANELLIEGENGYMFSAGDINELTQCLEKMVNNRTELKTMGKRSKELVQKCGYDEIIAGWKKAVRFTLTR